MSACKFHAQWEITPSKAKGSSYQDPSAFLQVLMFHRIKFEELSPQIQVYVHS